MEFEFVISASAWMKKDKAKGHREFYFAARSEEERDDWITTVEFLKAVSVHKNFKSSFGANISIPTRADAPGIRMFDQSRGGIMSLSHPHSPERAVRNAMTRKISHMNSQPQNNTKIEKDLKENVKGMFNYMFVHFASHLMEHSFRCEERSLSQTPEMLEENQLFDKIKEQYAMVLEFRNERLSLLSSGYVSRDLFGGSFGTKKSADPSIANNEPEIKTQSIKEDEGIIEEKVEEKLPVQDNIIEVKEEDQPIIEAAGAPRNADEPQPNTENLAIEEVKTPTRKRTSLEVASNEAHHTPKEEVEGEVDESIVQAEEEEELPTSKVNKTATLQSDKKSPEKYRLANSLVDSFSSSNAKRRQSQNDNDKKELSDKLTMKEFHNLSPMKTKAKYNEGKECLTDTVLSNQKYTSSSNELQNLREGSPRVLKKEMSIVELQRMQKSPTMPRDSEPYPGTTEVIMSELKRMLEEKLSSVVTAPLSSNIKHKSSKSPSKGHMYRQKEQIVYTDTMSKVHEDFRSKSKDVSISLTMSNMAEVMGQENDTEELQESRINERSLGPEKNNKDEVEEDKNEQGNQDKKYGFVTKNVWSIGGDEFELKENTMVTVEKLDEEDNIVTCTFKELTGIFPLEAIKIGNAITIANSAQEKA